MNIILLDNNKKNIARLTHYLFTGGHNVVCIATPGKLLKILGQGESELDLIICNWKDCYDFDKKYFLKSKEIDKTIEIIVTVDSANNESVCSAPECGGLTCLDMDTGFDKISGLLAKVEVILTTKNLSRTKVHKHLSASAQEQNYTDHLFARKLQNHIMPQEFAWLPRSQVVIKNLPMSSVGGDCVEIREYGNGKALIMVADLPGHGKTAAYATIAFKSWFTSLENDLSPVEVLRRANEMILDVFPDDFLVTAFCALYDDRNHLIEYSIAGAPTPFIFCQCKKTRFLRGCGPALGLSKHLNWEIYQDNIAVNELLFIYTDGLSQNPETIIDSLCDQNCKKCSYTAPQNLSEIINGLFNRTIEREPQHSYIDDISIVVLGPLTAAPQKEKATIHQKKVLVIDDDKALQSVIKTVLERNGVETIVNDSAVNLKEMLTRYSPDLLMIDIMLPDIRGIDSLKNVRVNFPSLPVVMISGLPSSPIANLGLELNIAGFLQKPFSPEELIATADQAINYEPNIKGVELDDMSQGWLDFEINSSSSTLEFFTKYLS